MPLGLTKLLQLVKKERLVEGLSERELRNPEGAGFDLRLGKLFKLKGKGFLGVEERKTPDVKVVAEYKNGKRNKYTIKPGEYLLMQTIESVNMPENLTAHNFPRSTLFRSGIQLLATQVAPGYKGELTFGIKNVGNVPVTIEMGARVSHIQFFEVSGKGNRYRGQWQGGRVAATKKEKQI